MQNSEFDFVEKVSADFPINVLVRPLDVPVSDTGMLIDWGNQMVANTDPDYTEHLITDPDSDQYKHLPFRSPAALEVFEYGREPRPTAQGRGRYGLDQHPREPNPEDGSRCRRATSTTTSCCS